MNRFMQTGGRGRRRSNVKLMLALGMSAYVALLVGLLSSGKLHAVAAQEIERHSSSGGNGQRQGGGLSSYFNSARQLLSSSLEAHNQAKTYSNLMPNEDPRTAQLLRATIDDTTDLINNYRQEGLSNMPPLPNVPGLGTLMRLPDKLLRAELTVLQHGIRMAQELRERPITATMNTPAELGNMFVKVLAQLNQ